MKTNGLNGIMPVNDGWASLKYSPTHHGIDIGWLSKYSKNGKTQVVAWANGTVVQCGQITERIGGRKYYPTVVVLKHSMGGKTLYTRYWHLVKGSVTVKKGQKVVQGQKLGLRGNTGKSFGVHLHFELKVCPKGTSYKKASTPWNRYNVNPVPYTFVLPSQHFKKGDYKFDNAPKLTVLSDELMVHTSYTESSEIVGTVSLNESYTVLNEMKRSDGMWYKIGDKKWVTGKVGVE